MAGRILHMAPKRFGANLHWTVIVAACLAAAAAGIALTRLGDKPSTPAAEPRLVVARAGATEAARSSGVTPIASTEPASTAAAVACPLQSLVLARRGAPLQTVCMDATSVQQTGSVRSYVVNAGDAEGWRLRLDMVDRRLASASLQARDGRSYACDGERCQGTVVLTHADATPRLSLRGLMLKAGADAGDLTVSAELRVPADDQVPGLACTGPSISIATAEGATSNFCGLGGAGVEIDDHGARNYRFQDLEGRTLMVAVDAEQRVVAVELDSAACHGTACRGASTTSVEPDNPLAERSFFFGRTALHDGRTVGMVLSGTLVMPAQQ